MIVGDSWSGKNNALLNLISYQPEIDKTYVNLKDQYEPCYQSFNQKSKDVGIKHCNNS